MKKFAALLSIIMILFSLTACSGTPTYTWETSTPWGENTECYEKSVYDLKVYSREKVDKVNVNKDLLATGSFTLTLSQAREDKKTVATLTSALEVIYADEEFAKENRGLTDTITSTVKFTKESLTPIYSERKYNQAVRKMSDGSYKENNSYEYVADYSTNKASLSQNKSVNSDGSLGDYITTETNFSLKNGTRVFDSEQLYYVARATTQVAPSSSATLNLSSIYEIANTKKKNGKYKFIPMTMASNDVLKEVDLENIFSDFTMNAKDENGNAISTAVKKVNCMSVAIGIDNTNAGPSTLLTMSVPGTIFTSKANLGKTSKIITEIFYARYNLDTSEESETYTYSLTSYTTSKPTT